mmetsp:Transcript_42703/g.103703  ORF Transcript_42703/g.103703 Transcript_42703/m.103703 type:complete len:137 (-) Transcript_42703:75-485(-)
MRASFAGFVSHGPQLHFWCLLLDRYVSFGGTSWGLVAKIALDQTFFASYMNAAFCFIVELLQGRSLGDVVKKVRLSWWPSLKASWRFWPAAHAITFTFIPMHLRVLWVDILEIMWVTILSRCVSGTRAHQSAEPSS